MGVVASAKHDDNGNDDGSSDDGNDEGRLRRLRHGQRLQRKSSWQSGDWRRGEGDEFPLMPSSSISDMRSGDDDEGDGDHEGNSKE